MPSSAGQKLTVTFLALKALAAEVGDKNISLIAAGVAFFALLSLFPGLAALVAIWALFSDPASVNEQLSIVQPLIPADVHALIELQLTSIASAQSETLGWAGLLSLLIAFWLARAGVGSMMLGLNMIYGEANRSSFRHYATSLGLAAALTFVGIVSLALIVVAPIVLEFVPLGAVTEQVISVTRWMILFAVLLLGAGLLYRIGPNRRSAQVGWITPGAVTAVILWVAASIAFSAYISAFDSYNRTYGSIGAVVAMMVWLYLSSFLLLLGAGLNAQLELRTLPDTTVGPDRPRGERGAYVADRYVPGTMNRAE